MRYIGCKKLLLEEIESFIDENVEQAETFCDIFSGTVCVANYFKPKYKIISNDLLSFSYFIQKGVIENSKIPNFQILKDKKNIDDPIDYFNNLTLEEIGNLAEEKCFCQNNYSPIGNRMYFTERNALKIDYIRNKINDWKKDNFITLTEYYYLVAALIEAVPFVSNISGTYGAYNKWWDKRALNDLKLEHFNITDNKKENEVYNTDGNELVNSISGDILYIDPPYNSRQYAPNYHVLETIALYDFPQLKGITGLRDYSGKKSKYCVKSNVLEAFENLIKKANFKHIILSYSNEGLMNITDIEKILKNYGKADTYKLLKIPYRRFKSRETNSKKQLHELLFYVRKDV